MSREQLEKQMTFIREVDRVKEIVRQTYLCDGSRKENDAEHSWHLALMAALLAEYANEPVDVAKVMKMVLIHDLVEIDAGDTYAYDLAGNKDKREREEKGADRIFGLLPQEQCQEYRELWEEFEALETPEARYCNMLDKVQPILLNDASKGRSWQEHGVAKEQVIARNSKTPEGSKEIWEYCLEILDRNQKEGKLK